MSKLIQTRKQAIKEAVHTIVLSHKLNSANGYEKEAIKIILANHKELKELESINR